MQTKTYKRYAKKLTKAIYSFLGVDYSANLYDWICVFKQLEKRRGYTRKQIRDVVYWYATAIEKEKVYEQYLPQAFTSDEFLQKFDKLVLKKKELEKKDEPEKLPETDLTKKQVCLIMSYVEKLHEMGKDNNFETKATIRQSCVQILEMYEELNDFEVIEEHLHWLTCRMVQEWDWCPGVYKGASFRNRFDEIKKKKKLYEKKFGALSLSTRGVKIEDDGVISQQEYLEDLF